jgi:hypothetical protein
MDNAIDIVDEMLGMAKEPATFSQDDLAEMIIVAATEIIKLREIVPPATKPERRGRNLATA